MRCATHGYIPEPLRGKDRMRMEHRSINDNREQISRAVLNGQQGDIWDPQKDLAVAWLGGIISAAIVIRYGASNR